MIFDESELIESINYLTENSKNFNNEIFRLRSEIKYFMKSKERIIEIFKEFK